MSRLVPKTVTLRDAADNHVLHVFPATPIRDQAEFRKELTSAIANMLLSNWLAQEQEGETRSGHA